MATAAQIAANRRNATKSTGPRTVEGKDRARMNALVHGLTASTLERPEEAERRVLLREQFLAEWQPGSMLEAAVLDQMADVVLELERVPEARAATLLMMRHRQEVPEHITNNELVSADLGSAHSRIERIQTYQGKLSRQLTRLTRDLRQLQQDRAQRDAEEAQVEIEKTKPIGEFAIADLRFANEGGVGEPTPSDEMEKTNPISVEGMPEQAVRGSREGMKTRIAETNPIGTERLEVQGVEAVAARVGWPTEDQIERAGRRLAVSA